jgi:hypothetical protein
VRDDVEINTAIVSFVEQNQVKTVIVADRIIGCPHEEGTDYPAGEVCPRCPFWANRDRWTGQVVS